MNYIKNPTLRPAVFPKVKDASENYSIGIQYNDTEEAQHTSTRALAVLFPGLTTYGYVGYVEDTLRVKYAANTDLPFYLDKPNDEQTKAYEDHPIKVKCWRVISQQLHIECLNTDAIGTFEAIRVPSSSFTGIQWFHGAHDSYAAPTEGFPDYQTKNFNGGNYQGWKNNPSYVSGTLQDLNRCYFQLNLVHQHWPWVCQCCENYCETPQTGEDIDENDPIVDDDPPVDPPVVEPPGPGTGNPPGGGGDPIVPPVVPPVFPPGRPDNNEYTTDKPAKVVMDDSTEMDDTEITIWDEPIDANGIPAPLVWYPPLTLPVKHIDPDNVGVISDVNVNSEGYLYTNEILDNGDPQLPINRPQTVTTTDPLVRGNAYEYMVDWVNARRAGESMPPLTYDSTLAYAAQFWADDIVDSGNYKEWQSLLKPGKAHDMPGLGTFEQRLEDLGIPYVNSGIMECLAEVPVPAAFESWVGEGPGGGTLNHWDIFMNPNATKFGVGSAITEDGKYITIFLPGTNVPDLNLPPLDEPEINIPATYANWEAKWDTNNVGGRTWNDLQLPQDWWQWTPKTRRAFQEYVNTAKQQPWGVFPLQEQAPVQAITNPDLLPRGLDAYEIVRNEPSRPWPYNADAPQSPQDNVNGSFGTRFTRLDSYDRTIRVLDRTYGQLKYPPTTNIWPNQTNINRSGSNYQDWPIFVYKFATTYDVTQMKDPLGKFYEDPRDFIIYEFYVYHRQNTPSYARLDLSDAEILPEEIFFNKNTDELAYWTYVDDYADKTIPFPFPDFDPLIILNAMQQNTKALLAPPKWKGDFSLYVYSADSYPAPDSTGMIPEDAWFTFSGFIPTEIIVNYANANATKWNKSPMALAAILFQRANELMGQFNWPIDFFIDITDAVPTNIDDAIITYVASKPVDTRFFSLKGHQHYLAMLWYNYLVKIPLTPSQAYYPQQFPLFSLQELHTEHWPTPMPYRGVMNWAKSMTTLAWKEALETTTRLNSNSYSVFISNLFYPKASTYNTFQEFDAVPIEEAVYSTYTGYTSRYDKQLHEEHMLQAKLQRKNADECELTNWRQQRQDAYDAAVAARQAEIAADTAARQALVDARQAEIDADLTQYNTEMIPYRALKKEQYYSGSSLLLPFPFYEIYSNPSSPILISDDPMSVADKIPLNSWPDATQEINSINTYRNSVSASNSVLISTEYHIAAAILGVSSIGRQVFSKTTGPNIWNGSNLFGSGNKAYLQYTGCEFLYGDIRWVMFPTGTYTLQTFIDSIPTQLSTYGDPIWTHFGVVKHIGPVNTTVFIVHSSTPTSYSKPIPTHTLFYDNTMIGPPTINWIQVDSLPPPLGPCPEEPQLRHLTPTYTKATKIGIDCYASQTAAIVAGNQRNDPDGIGWLSNWPTWDGVTTINVCTSTAAQISAWIWPGGNPWKMRGLRDLYYQVNPFADLYNPTVREIELWHVQVILHARRLCGITLPLVGDDNLYMRAHWASERKWSEAWDADYPAGICTDKTGIDHCGAGFLPLYEDQIPYFQAPGQTEVVLGSGSASEGIFTVQANVPWCIKFTRMMAPIITDEGITGHGGPFFGAERVGIAFSCDGTYPYIRIKWGGGPATLCP